MKLRTLVLMAIATLLLATVSRAQTSALSAVARIDDGGNDGTEPTNYYVDVLFSGSMDANSALNPANYSIAGATITGATFFTNNANLALSNMVILKLTAPLNTSFTLRLTNVLDGLGNPVSNSSVSGTVDPLQSVDIAGVPDELPIAVRGTTFSTGPGSYAIDASGADIYNPQDSFRFDYTTRTNDFDIVVRITSLVPADGWSKAGLMVRETIDPDDGGSRMMCIAGTPAPSSVPLDGTTPIDDITGDWRDAPDTAAFEAFEGDNGNMYYCMGDGILTPDYPNQWLRLTRQLTATSDLYTGYSSPDGKYWTMFEYWDAARDNHNGDATALPNVVYVGIASCASAGSSYSNALMTATCANFGDYTNNTPPSPVTSVLNAVARVDDGGNNGTEPTSYYVDVLFSGSMGATSALNPANYSLAGATITGATFFTNNANVALSNMVILKLTAQLNTSFTLQLTNVLDGLGNPVSNSSVNGTVDPLQSVDIPGVADGLPIAVRGTTFSTRPGSYAVDASGADIYNAQDSFRFDYTTRTNNFDIVVQVTSELPADQWSKAGLMVRESIDPNDGGSRMMFIGGTPASSSVPLDGTTPINDITGDWRDAPDSGAFNGNNGNIYHYLGEGVINPNYPNQWLRLTRQLTATNDLYTGYCSPDGINWTVFEYWDAAKDNHNGDATALPSVVYVGIASCAHIYPGSSYPNALVTATYANFGDYIVPTNNTPSPSYPGAVARVDDGGNNGAEPTNYNVDVLFSGNMDASTALNPANYSISGSTITNATFFTNNANVALSNMVILKLTAPLSTSFTLQLNSNAFGGVVTNLTVNGTVDSLQSVDIAGVPDGLPIAVRGTTFSTGPGSYAIDASGADIYNPQDSFRFDYTTRTNNFDIVVKVTSLLPADQWSKAGLMVRETIDPDDGGSRMMCVASVPALSSVPLDGTINVWIDGLAGGITGDWRDAPDYPADNLDNGNISYFLTDGIIAPNYPNQWLRLTRKLTATSDLYTGYSSPDGTNWMVVEYWDAAKNTNYGYAIPFPSVVNVGIASCAHIWPGNSYSNVQMTATYTNFGDYVAPSTPAPPAIPSVLSAVARRDDGGNNGAEPTSYCVDVLFDQGMIANPALNPANYSISGATITNASFFTNNTGVALFDKVILKLAAPLNTSFTLQLTSNVVNNLGNALSNLTVNGTVDSLQSVDIAGVPDKLPIAVRGTTFCTGPGSYAIDASGSDIYNPQDSFRFDYTTRTNNFDIVVRIKSLVPADQWSKAGLMVRQTIDPNDGGSRMMFVGGTPDLSFAPLDCTPPPINDITGDWRDAPDSGAFNGNNGNIYHYLGDGVIKPNYPNQWLRLTRQLTATSDLYTGYCSPDGINWTRVEYWDAAKDNHNGDATALPSVVYVGIASCAHIYPGSSYPDALVTATYANFGDYVPMDLSATAGSDQVALTWNASAGATSYNVKRSTTSGQETTLINVSGTSYTDTSVTNGTTYYYVVSAVKNGGQSPNSSEVSATPNFYYEILNVNSGLALEVANGSTIAGGVVDQYTYSGSAQQQWTLTSLGSGKYELLNNNSQMALEVTNGSTNAYALAVQWPYTNGLAQEQWTLTSLGSGKYIITNVNSGLVLEVYFGRTTNGAAVDQYPYMGWAQQQWTIRSLFPAAPTGLNATAGHAQVALAWNSSSGATSYNVKRSTTSGGEVTVANVSGTNYTNTGLANGTTYYYEVSALNAGGESTNSLEVSATPVAPPVVNPTVSGGNLILTGSGGTPGAGYTWLTTTNLSVPIASWTTNTTGVFDGTGAFSNAIPINNSQRAQFYLLRTP